MNGIRLVTFAGVAALLAAGCNEDGTGGSSLSETPPPAGMASWNVLDWEPIDCTELPDTPAEVALTPRSRPDLELLALHFSTGIVARTSPYERLAADLDAITVLEPKAPTGYHAPHDGRQILLHAAPQTLSDMADGSYDAWGCLNAHYQADSFQNRGHYGLLHLKGTYELTRLAELYAQLSGITAAEPNYTAGDGSTLYVTRVGDDWHYVADLASGDCPAGCIDHVLFYFISEPGGAVRYMDQWSVAYGQEGPNWVETYWRRAETRVGPPPSADAPTDGSADFDRERALAEARSLLGLPEAELQPGTNLRIARRGEERFPLTMDLRPGRLNVELDDDGSGEHVVTRVVVETPEGSIVIE